MSYQAVRAVLQHSKAKGAARMVLVVLAEHARADGTNAKPGGKLICQESQLSERAVKGAIKDLLAMNEAVVETQGGGNIATSYRVNLPIEKAETGVQNPSGRGANPAPLPVQNSSGGGADFAPVGVQNPSGRGAKSVREGCKIRRAYKEEPSWNHKEPSKSIHTAPLTDADSLAAGDADRFPGETDEFETALLDVCQQRQRAYWAIAQAREQAKILRSAGFTLEELKSFDGKTPKLNFCSTSLLAWRRDRSLPSAAPTRYAQPSRQLSRDEQNRLVIEQATRNFNAEIAAKQTAAVDGEVIE